MRWSLQLEVPGDGPPEAVASACAREK